MLCFIHAKNKAQRDFFVQRLQDPRRKPSAGMIFCVFTTKRFSLDAVWVRNRKALARKIFSLAPQGATRYNFNVRMRNCAGVNRTGARFPRNIDTPPAILCGKKFSRLRTQNFWTTNSIDAVFKFDGFKMTGDGRRGGIGETTTAIKAKAGEQFPPPSQKFRPRTPTGTISNIGNGRNSVHATSKAKRGGVEGHAMSKVPWNIRQSRPIRIAGIKPSPRLKFYGRIR